jgi:nicotinamidase-related amidase
MRKAALLLIDLQKEGGTPDGSMTNIAGAGMGEVLRNAEKLIAAARASKMPVLYTRHVNRADGRGLVNREPVDAGGRPLYYREGTEAVEIHDVIRPQAGDVVIDKRRQSAFFETELDLVLRGSGISHLVVAGVLTDCCVFNTVQGAFDRNYGVTLIHDACGTTSIGAHMAAVMIMANWVYDIEIASTEGWTRGRGDDCGSAWRAGGFDELAFTPENMREMYARMEDGAGSPSLIGSTIR